MRSTHRLIIALLIAVALVGAGVPTVLAADATPDPDEIVRLYDSGRYDEARTLLERLDAGGGADGVMLYRLAFCQLRAGERSASQRTMERARADLEQRVTTTREILVPFYLANTYQNLGLTAELTRVAGTTVARVERGEIDVDGGVDEFRVAKLYADLGRGEPAAMWYGRALESFSGHEAQFEAYVRWARDYLARQSSPAVAPTRPPAPATDAGRADAEAVDHARSGRYAEAAEAWRRSGQLRPVDPNRARYCGMLARTAASFGELPETAPDGRVWSELDKGALHGVLLEQAAIARGARRLAAALEQLPPRTADGTRWSKLPDDALRARLATLGSGQDPPPRVDTGDRGLSVKRRAALRARLEAELSRTRPVFVAAGLWFGIGGHGLRETAFFGGFAPLIFRDAEWSLDGS